MFSLKAQGKECQPSKHGVAQVAQCCTADSSDMCSRNSSASPLALYVVSMRMQCVELYSVIQLLAEDTSTAACEPIAS